MACIFLAIAQAAVLVDPLGLVFESGSGTPINGTTINRTTTTQKRPAPSRPRRGQLSLFES